jgi:asparagine synthase (glutamine-hydrolysing)
MCGITGFVDLRFKVDVSTIQSMTDSLIHRGPDDGSVFISKNQQLAFGHRRLSFLDLSPTGKQPLISNDGEVIITFNGEIYNFLELKTELESSYEFKTNTDTEVIIAGYQKWGINVISRLKGMFAFGLYDQKLNQLFLVRDRFGIKPLYFSIQDSKLLFASELKAILATQTIKKEINFTALVDYFVYRYIPSPKTIWDGIQKLPPATFAKINLNDLSCEFTEYWQLKYTVKSRNKGEIINDVQKLINQSVSQHLRADVSIGSFLSGGYDSSALVVFMKKMKINPETFSIGFSNWEKSEEQFAKIVADHLQVSNQSIIADEKSLDLVDIMPDVYDEPIADISIIPTYMVSKLACSKVKAVVSGEGADEIFCGYTWHKDFYKNHYLSSFITKVKQRIFPSDTVSFYANAMAMGWFDEKELRKMLHPRLHEFIPKDIHWFYRKHFDKSLTPMKSIQKMDIKCFMGELVLTKVDRASMSNSLEVRVPFLDHELVEYVFGLEESQNFKVNQTKFLLFKNIENYLPKEILKREKQGFVGPDSYYMNLNWYKNQLKNSKLVELNIVNQAYIDKLLKESYNWKLWKLLIMEKWIKKWLSIT